jgi:hypothetical protein
VLLYVRVVHGVLCCCVQELYMEYCVVVYKSCTWNIVLLCTRVVRGVLCCCVQELYMECCVVVYKSCTWSAVLLCVGVVHGVQYRGQAPTSTAPVA